MRSTKNKVRKNKEIRYAKYKEQTKKKTQVILYAKYKEQIKKKTNKWFYMRSIVV